MPRDLRLAYLLKKFRPPKPSPAVAWMLAVILALIGQFFDQIAADLARILGLHPVT
jgi:hypothetical protein